MTAGRPPISRQDPPSTPPEGVAHLRKRLELVEAAIQEVSEQIGRLAAEFGSLKAELGGSPAPPRVGSSPQLERLLDLRLDEEETEVRARRLRLEAEQQARAARLKREEDERIAANQRRADLWALAYKWAAFVGPWIGGLVGAAIMRACGGH